MRITPEEQLLLERVRREWDIKGSLQDDSKMAEFIVNIFRLGIQAGRRNIERKEGRFCNVCEHRHHANCSTR